MNVRITFVAFAAAQKTVMSLHAGHTQTTSMDLEMWTKTNREPQSAVWLTSYPRSGSSTLLSMMVSPLKGEDSRIPESTFSLFEPCHDGDEYQQNGRMIAQDKMNRKCEELLPKLLQCDYSTAQKIWGWSEPHTTSNHSKFSPGAASRLCKGARNVAIKTVDWGHDLSQWLWMLDNQPNLKIIEVVRDPRSIYASWKDLEPFKTLVKAGNYYKLTDICESYAKNIDVDHPRVKQVVYENLVKKPWDVAREVYGFVGRKFRDRQRKWVSENFDATSCPPAPPGAIAYTDCHTKSQTAEAITKWREILNEEERLDFNQSYACQRVASYYGFDV